MIVDRLHTLSAYFAKKQIPKTAHAIFEGDKRVIANIVFFNEPSGVKTSLFVILDGLYKLAVNDKIKLDLYFNMRCKEYMKLVVLSKDCEYEAKCALRYRVDIFYFYVANSNCLIRLK
jgi:hypothetical protein